MRRTYSVISLLCISVVIAVSGEHTTLRDNALYYAFTDYKEETASFLNTVLPVVDMTECDVNPENVRNHALYKQLQHCNPPARMPTMIARQLYMLNKQRNVLTNQTQNICDSLGIAHIEGVYRNWNTGNIYPAQQQQIINQWACVCYW